MSERDFAAAKDSLSKQLYSISSEANSNRMMCLSTLTNELNQLLQ